MFYQSYMLMKIDSSIDFDNFECQGEQHYKTVDEFGGETQFETQKMMKVNENMKQSIG